MARVLTHRADPDSVLHGNTANRERLEESRHGSSIAGLNGEARWGILFGGEEGNALCCLVGDGMATFFGLCWGGCFRS